MIKILCYGDSNVYGFIPQNGARYDKNCRWSGLLPDFLPVDVEVIEQGMNNRTGFFKNPEGLKQSGGEYLPIYLQNHKDIDICILSLGTNDAQKFYNLNQEKAKQGLINLVKSIKEANQNTKIIIIPPVKITKNILSCGFSFLFNEKSIQTIQDVFPVFKEFSAENNCLYFDFNEITSPSEIDGLHYSQESHKLIAISLAKFITEHCLV